MKNKNILIIIGHLGLGGGAMKSAVGLGNSLSKKGYNISYLTFYEKKDKYDFKGSYYSLNEKINFSFFSRIYKLINRTYNINKICKNSNIDVCISFLEDSNLSNILSFNKTKKIISIRGSLEEQPHSSLIRILIKFLYPKADYITTIVKEETQNLINNYGIKPEKVSNIYNMFDIHDIKEKSKEDLGKYKDIFNNGKFTFINIGRLSIQKNQKILLEAFDIFHKQNPNSQLVILGNGELKKDLQNQADNLSSKDNIYFVGVHTNPYKFLANADCYVSSSAWEGMSRVLIEAMACSLPIITTDHPTGAKEIMKKDIQNFEEVKDLSKEEYGILVPNKDMEKLSKAMELICNDESLRKKYSLKSLERCKDFDTDKIIGEWESIL